MPKKKCSPKQLAALARGRAKRQKKITKGKYKCKNIKRRTRDNYDGQPPMEEYPMMPPEDYIPPPPARDFPNPSDYPDPPSVDNPPNNQPVINLYSKPPEMATQKEQNEIKKDNMMFAKIKNELEQNPKYRNPQEPTIKIAYNGIPIDVPVSMIPKDKDFLTKYGEQIKNGLIAAGCLGVLGFGGGYGIKLANSYVMPVLKKVFGIASAATQPVETAKNFTRSTIRYIGKFFK